MLLQRLIQCDVILRNQSEDQYLFTSIIDAFITNRQLYLIASKADKILHFFIHLVKEVYPMFEIERWNIVQFFKCLVELALHNEVECLFGQGSVPVMSSNRHICMSICQLPVKFVFWSYTLLQLPAPHILLSSAKPSKRKDI